MRVIVPSVHEAVPYPDAPLGRSDVTRRWALALGDGAATFAGVTRTEADRFGPALSALPVAERAQALVPVELGVVLSDGAGPYLLGADGILLLAVGPHPSRPGESVVMGSGAPGGHRVGTAAPAADGLWAWRARAEVADADRIAALDDLAATGPGTPLAPWADRWGRPAGEPPNP